MAYQSKTYSLSDEVVAAIEAAKAGGESPNKFLKRALGLNFACHVCGKASIGAVDGVPVFDHRHSSAKTTARNGRKERGK